MTIKSLSPLSRQDTEFTFDDVAEATGTNSGTIAWEPDNLSAAPVDQKSTTDIDFATTIMYSDVSNKISFRQNFKSLM